MLKLKSLRTQRGDTILEVLIATAVLTLVLTIAYTAANRGTQSIRQAQERGESARYTETQIEQLKAFISRTATPVLPASGTKFCIKNDGNPEPFTLPIDNNAQNEDFSAWAPPAVADCKKDDLYYTYIERNGDTFTSHTRWTKVNGRGIDEATMVHRVFPDLASGAGGGGSVSAGCAPNFFYNAVGGCTPCPVGYTSPGGFSTSCAPIPPQIQVAVQKISPNPDNTTPSCGNPGTDATGIAVQLNSGPGTPYNGTSTALFTVDGFYSYYTAIITGMPGGFELCSSPPPTRTTPIGTPAGSNTVQMSFKIRPVCYVVTTYTDPYPHSWSAHDHGYDYPIYSPYYQIHTGYSGYYPFQIPNGFMQWQLSQVGYTDPETGSPVVLAVYYKPPPGTTTSTFRNRFEYHRYIAGYGHTYIWHYHPEDVRGDPIYTNTCPS